MSRGSYAHSPGYQQANQAAFEAMVRAEYRALEKDEGSIETEIKAKGLNAPRLTPEQIDERIASEWYTIVPGSTVTLCALTLRNGFVVVGHSACAVANNFDEAIGRKLARARAREQIWQLEGYLLCQQLACADEAWMHHEWTHPVIRDAEPM